VQTVLERITGEKDETLDFLMNMKKQWMDANGITGYLD
jgi:hypothetical protein